jgi:hypothetical protein
MAPSERVALSGEIELPSLPDVALTRGLFTDTIHPVRITSGGSPRRRSDLDLPPSLLSRGPFHRLTAIEVAILDLHQVVGCKV